MQGPFGPILAAVFLGLGAVALSAQDAADESKLVELSPKVHRAWKFRLPEERWSVVGTKIDLEDSLGSTFATRATGTAIEFDLDGDGRFDAKVEGQSGFVVLKGKSGKYALRLRNQGRWECAPASSMQGKIGKTRVRVIDLDGNGRFDDYGRDAMIVGSGRSGSYLSRVIALPDGSLHEIEMAPHGRSLLLQPFAGDTGSLSIAWPNRGKVLRAVVNSVDGRHSFELSAKLASAIKLPEGEYYLHSALIGLSDRRVSVDQGKAETVEVDAREPTVMELGGPLVAEYGFARRGRDYQFDPYDIAYFGRGGERYYAWTPDGKSPRIVVRARKTGREIAQSYFPGSG
jgi:hypothetical protein